ncbi:hypothetical protein M404DRAFT_1001989 [Pisolithus tinctorius Marx 270]|uniref:Uncharacterized protein n=1 Tax=Pisolithus tinctorius Marx 270 TaxID=870435 RepID=A0A0C3JZD9_PISTI|nr:hypothetical protein M404DRAFT_1001989 [Pisolithus tinctorius Marx 270]
MSQSATRPVKAVGGTSSYTVTATIDRWKVQANSPSPRQDTCFDIGGPTFAQIYPGPPASISRCNYLIRAFLLLVLFTRLVPSTLPRAIYKE